MIRRASATVAPESPIPHRTLLTLSAPRSRCMDALSPHGFSRVGYHEWGKPDNPRVVICVHGLARTGRDFDVLGEALSATHRVLAVDLPGRGLSDWLTDPNDYTFPTYLAALTALIARSNVDEVSWVGTSLGGLLGIVMAAQEHTPVTRLVVNDVGPAIEAAALERIGAYIGQAPTFGTIDEISHYVRTISAPFGALSDEQWEHLIQTSVVRHPDGRWAMHYDPGIAVPFRAAPAPADLWPLWDAIRCPTLVLRGADSDLLSAATAAAMAARGPKPKVVTFQGVGHAPMLLSQEQVGPVCQFLRTEA
jgi:pimeloyl-ACP methyl ester carboxylesterase